MTIRDVAVRAYREALPTLSASAVGGLFAGVVLGGMKAELRAVPGLLVLVPALLATRGNVFGSLGARLASALHQGMIEPSFVPLDDRVPAVILASLADGILVSLFAATVAYAILPVLGFDVAPLATLVSIAFLAAVFSGLALTVAVVAVVFVGYRRGYNPDALVGPLVTTIGDVFGIAFLLLAVRIVLALGGG